MEVLWTSFQYGFFQRALLAGLGVGLACALLGVFLVLRKDAMIGHGLAHISFAGVAVGLFFGWLPLFSALGLTVVTAGLLVKIRQRAGVYGDTAIALVSSFGFALGILLVSISKGLNVNLFAYLFGDILTISTLEVEISLALAAVVVLVIIFYFRDFLFATFDPEAAQVAGIPEKRVEYLLTVLAGVTVVLGMKVVGLLLVVALMVIPAASALRLARNFRHALGLAVVFSLSEILVGLCLSFLLDIPASAGIVLLGFAVYLVVLFSGSHGTRRV